MQYRRLLKSVLLSLLIAVILLSSFSVSLVAASDKEDNVLIVGVPVDRCPVFYRDRKSDEIEGIGAELMRVAAEEAGYRAIFVELHEENLKDALDNDEYDLVMPFGSAIESTSGKKSIVSDNLIQTPFTLVTEGNRPVPPLNKIRVGMLQSLAGAAQTVKELYPGIEIIFYDDMNDSVKALRSGKVDALLHNSYVWSYVLQKPSYSDLTVQPSAMFSMDFRAGTLDTPEGREFIERINEGIAKVPDTRKQAIILDYTTRRLYRNDFFDYIHEYGLLIFLTVLLGASLVVIVIMRVRSMKREQEEKMQKLIDMDPLTGALSLEGFRKRVEELLSSNPDTPYLLTYVNVKNFKYINESLGMSAGDDFLKFFVDKSKESLHEDEALCRIGADHFAVLTHFEGEEGLKSDDREVLDVIRNYFIDRGKENRVQICGGIYVLTHEDYQDISMDRMLDKARVAEKRVFDTRKDGYEIYNPEQWEKGKHVAEVTNRLPSALEAGDIQVWCQPQVDYETGKIIGAEALCRWDHTKLGWLHPSDFITTLEEADLIYDLDVYVWERVCQDLHRWNEMGIRRSVSVNVSRCDIREDRNIPGYLYNLVKKYDLTPEQLRIEITETAYAEKPAILIQNTIKLREFGFQVEMDDFGSGYSSLNMLKEVPVDRIKLDLHFLTDSGDPEKGRVIVSYMIQMVRAMGMTLIAEGVETVDQANFLRDQGSTEMQGFYFYRPMPVDEFEKLNTELSDKK